MDELDARRSDRWADLMIVDDGDDDDDDPFHDVYSAHE